jgi:hypothetical protein
MGLSRIACAQRGDLNPSQMSGSAGSTRSLIAG